MFEQQPTLELLFDQLGLDSDEASIENFIKTHQLPAEQNYMKHLFGQRSKRFLKSHWEKDDEWIVVIDELNEQLHEDSVKK